jgi:hypothetical protein
VIKTEERGSDVNLATYLLLDAVKQDCQAAVVISNDSDLKEPIAVAQRELGLIVGVINPHPPQRRSRALQPTFDKPIRGSALRTCQFPECSPMPPERSTAPRERSYSARVKAVAVTSDRTTGCRELAELIFG